MIQIHRSKDVKHMTLEILLGIHHTAGLGMLRMKPSYEN